MNNKDMICEKKDQSLHIEQNETNATNFEVKNHIKGNPSQASGQVFQHKHKLIIHQGERLFTTFNTLRKKN